MLTRMVLLLSPMVIALAFSMDIYVPALPHISHVFSVTAAQMQMTLTVFMFDGINQLWNHPVCWFYSTERTQLWQ